MVKFYKIMTEITLKHQKNFTLNCKIPQNITELKKNARLTEITLKHKKILL